MCLFRPSSKINSAYLHYILNGPIGRLQAQNSAVGTAHPHINISDIKAYRIPVSSITNQKRVVEKLNVLSAETKKLECIYEQKINNLEELKKSVLQKAFTGELKTTKAVAV